MTEVLHGEGQRLNRGRVIDLMIWIGSEEVLSCPHP